MKNNIVTAANGKRRKTSYKKGQILTILPQSDADLSVSTPAKIIDMPIENTAIVEEIIIPLNEEVPNMLLPEESGVVLEEIQFIENEFNEPVILFGKKIQLNPIYSRTAFNLIGSRCQGGIHFRENNTKTY